MTKKEYVLQSTHHPLPHPDVSNQYDTCLEVVREQIDSALINLTDIERWLHDVQYMLNQARTHASKWLSQNERERYCQYDEV